MKRVGRNIVKGAPVFNKYTRKLSIVRRFKRAYYRFKIRQAEKRKAKLASYSDGYQKDLFNSFVYLEMHYLYKIESLYSKQEIRDYERGVKRDS